MENKGSRSGSKSNLNESALPLLEDVGEGKGDTPEKEKIEMETKIDVKEESGKEEEEAPAKEADAKDEKKKKKKEKKEKPPKTHKRTPSCVETLTVGLNLLDRDEKHINDHINLVFEDVLAEPDANHGIDGVWKLTYLVFTTTRLWVYRIFAAILALPCGITWGLFFSLLSLFNIWIITPVLRTFDIFLHVFHRVWAGLVRTLLDPLFQSVGKVVSDVRITRTQVYPGSDYGKDP